MLHGNSLSHRKSHQSLGSIQVPPLLMASNAGAATHPDWYRNLVAHPEVTVEFKVETFDATAVVIKGEEREQIWRKIVALYPFFAEHQAGTSRQIPVISLQRQTN